MKISTLLFFFVLIVNLTYSQKNDNRLIGLEQEIETLIKSYNAVGLSVSVVEGNEVLYSKGFGYRNLEKKIRVNKNTSFPIASCTKAFTSSLLGILASENKISLKDKPSSYIPNIQFHNEIMNNLISVEDLLSHRSGLGEVDGTLVLFPEKDRMKIIKKLKFIKPEGKVKDSWIYSNMGYTIAGAIVEQITNKAWEINIQDKIFNPLGMSSSFTDLGNMKNSKNFSYGYGLLNGQIQRVLFENYYDYSPAGGIISSSNDMANWMLSWLNNGKFKGKQVLPKDFINNATTIHNIRPNKNEENSFLYGDGLGWRMESNNGNYKVYHGGNTSGFSSLVLTYPFKKIGITVLTNQQNSILPYIIADIIKNRMLGLPKINIDDYPVSVNDIYVTSEVKVELNTEKKPTHNLLSFCGIYSNRGYGNIEIRQEKDKLHAIYPTYKFFLEHLHHNIFIMKPIKKISHFNPEFALNFKTNNDGEISAFSINLQSEPVEFKKQIRQ